MRAGNILTGRILAAAEDVLGDEMDEEEGGESAITNAAQNKEPDVDPQATGSQESINYAAELGAVNSSADRHNKSAAAKSR